MHSTPRGFILMTQEPLSRLQTRTIPVWTQCICRHTGETHQDPTGRRELMSCTRHLIVFQVFSQDPVSSFHLNLCQALNSSPNTRFQSRDKASAMVVHDWFKTLHTIFALVDRHTWASRSFHVAAATFRRLLPPTNVEDAHQWKATTSASCRITADMLRVSTSPVFLSAWCVVFLVITALTFTLKNTISLVKLTITVQRQGVQGKKRKKKGKIRARNWIA